MSLACALVVAPLAAESGALRWSEEFDQPVGAKPDPARWVYDLGNGHNGWGNQEKQVYTADAANASIVADPQATDGKALAITALKTETGFTSARIKTQGLHTFKYGRIEARLRLPRGQGIWPAFWMLGANLPDVGWPKCGEIDVMEILGHEPQKLYGTLHGPGYSGGQAIGGHTTLSAGTLADDYHLYAVTWAPDHIRWYLDGKQYHQVRAADVPPGAWVFNDQPHFLLLNLAVGGSWPGYPDATTVFPQTYLIDYVRVYSEESPSPRPVGAKSSGT